MVKRDRGSGLAVALAAAIVIGLFLLVTSLFPDPGALLEDLPLPIETSDG